MSSATYDAILQQLQKTYSADLFVHNNRTSTPERDGSMQLLDQ